MAKHYGVSVAICPPRSGHRKGVVEKINHSAAQRWWRTLSDELTLERARAGIEEFARTRGDTRIRVGPDGKSSVAVLAAAEPLRPIPAMAYPVILTEVGTVSRQALVSYRGNRYSVPPELAGAQVTVSRTVGAEVIDILTASQITIARHRLAADGTGAQIRDHGHVYALEHAAMSAASTGRPHRRKERIPPGPQALAAADTLRRNGIHAKTPEVSDQPGPRSGPESAAAADIAQTAAVIDLATYERAAHGRNTLT